MYGKAKFDNAPAGTFLRAIWLSRSPEFEQQQWAKAVLAGFGVERAELPTVSAGYLRDPETAKATLGATGATGAPGTVGVVAAGWIETNSTSKIMTELGPMTFPAPRSP